MFLSTSLAALALLTPTPPCDTKPTIARDAVAAFSRRASLAATAPLLTVVAPTAALAGPKDTVSVFDMAGNLVLLTIVLGLLAFVGNYALQFAQELGGAAGNIGDNIDKALAKENEGRAKAPRPTGPIYDDSNERDIAAFKAKPVSDKAKAERKKKNQLIQAQGAGAEYAPWMRGAFENMDLVAKREKERKAAKAKKARERLL